MWAKLLMCLCLTARSHAGIIASAVRKPQSSVVVTTSSITVDEDFIRLSESFLTNEEHNQLFGNSQRNMYNLELISGAVAFIAETEMRVTLGLPPPNPPTPYKHPSEEEVKAIFVDSFDADKYVDLTYNKERRTIASEKPIIAFLDKRFPEIRNTLKSKFRESLFYNIGYTPERIRVDRMMQMFYNLSRSTLGKALVRMYENREGKQLV